LDIFGLQIYSAYGEETRMYTELNVC